MVVYVQAITDSCSPPLSLLVYLLIFWYSTGIFIDHLSNTPRDVFSDVNTGSPSPYAYQNLELTTQTLHATRGYFAGMHTSLDGLNIRGSDSDNVKPYSLIAYFSAYSTSVDTDWLESSPELCDLNSARHVDVSYSSDDPRKSGGTYQSSAPDRVSKAPEYIQEVCGVHATAEELDDAQKVVAEKGKDWSTADVVRNTDHIHFLRHRINICHTLLSNGVTLSTDHKIVGWKSPTAKEICKTASPDNVYMWPDASTFGFSGSYIPRDLNRGVVFLLLIWAGISLVMLVQSDPFGEEVDRYASSFYWFFKLAHVLVMVVLTIVYVITTLQHSQSRGQHFVEHSEKPMKIFEKNGGQYAWNDQNGPQKIQNMMTTPSGSTTMTFFIIFVACVSYYRYTRRLTNAGKRTNQTYEMASSEESQIQSILGYEGSKERTLASPMVVVHSQGNDVPPAYTDKEWKISSFGIKPQRFAPDVDIQPTTDNTHKNVLLRKEVKFEVSWNNAALYSYMDWEIDTVFRIFLLPAFFLSEFSMRTVYSYDVEYQILFLGALSLCLLDFFMAIFHKICFLVMRIEENISKSHNIDCFILFVLEFVSFLIKLFIVLAITHVAEDRNENYVNMDYESVKLSVTQESSHFNAKVWTVFLIAEFFTLCRWINVWNTWNNFKGLKADPDFKLSTVYSNACGVAILFTIFVIVVVSYTRHFNQLPISKTLENDWYGHRVVSLSGVYTRIS